VVAAPSPSFSLPVGPSLWAGPPAATPLAFSLCRWAPLREPAHQRAFPCSLPSLSSPASPVRDPVPPSPGCHRPTACRSCPGPPTRARAMARPPLFPPRATELYPPFLSPPRFSITEPRSAPLSISLPRSHPSRLKAAGAQHLRARLSHVRNLNRAEPAAPSKMSLHPDSLPATNSLASR
jgi:hypothetical protein